MNALAACPAAAPARQFVGAKRSFSVKKAAVVRRDTRVRADFYLGCPENTIVCVNTAALLFAGRFGLAPTVNKNYGGSDSYTMTEAERPRVQSRDPSGFTIVDVAAWGSLAHIVAAGEILGGHAFGAF
mmetsp:Transcript_6990/g.10941  ORF Transcript_6990/g.10941 Transcript_6990/m.10941 type:complete len:128 (+) Transcript_6990:158-541(+)|eukprot:CAMPEP_0181359802 /NCGR_PEP_ID=MMETSP1106-20121128/6299_1 /TAXON_ID=81844 /ORGANISM="Mantoniella antarctica, Strain SL-175" /LENGTH=127 /DNA_ID=CAMNT_0023472977 /DNA_START=74 /DNA_END=457 /DNA_ORIENTATION=-